ncbi:hypothetical protein Dda_7163 [Drechslerella dactyloides]|uniref:F-box domain-containing protein n=1 Tax=Drechslerella dactyloides TaxID=74499 RepID=A0AAD6IUH3_DREDA|nr:hypothetical protein Dda_7163 [Drechslerella dactyloides]
MPRSTRTRFRARLRRTFRRLALLTPDTVPSPRNWLAWFRDDSPILKPSVIERIKELKVMLDMGLDDENQAVNVAALIAVYETGERPPAMFYQYGEPTQREDLNIDDAFWLEGFKASIYGSAVSPPSSTSPQHAPITIANLESAPNPHLLQEVSALRRLSLTLLSLSLQRTLWLTGGNDTAALPGKQKPPPSLRDFHEQLGSATANGPAAPTPSSSQTADAGGDKPLDLGLPECLDQSPAKRIALASRDNKNKPDRRITRHAAAALAIANDPALAKLRDPFHVLPDNVVREIILSLPNRTIVSLRRVSKYWKANVEYVITEAVVEHRFGERDATKKLREEAKLGWPEFAFRKNTFLDEARADGTPSSVKKFTNAGLWEKVGDRLVWIDESYNLNVQHLSAWDVNERKDSLVALAGNPRGMARNRLLHAVVAEEQRKPAERPKRASKKEKIPEAIVIRWPLRDTLKTRHLRIKVSAIIPYEPTHILLDYVQCPEKNFEYLANDGLPRRRRKLASVNIITGYADWNIHLDDYYPMLPFTFGMFLRHRFTGQMLGYLTHGHKLWSLTTPNPQWGNNPYAGFYRETFLTVRDLRTGAVTMSKPVEEISEILNVATVTPEHFLISPDGKIIVLCANRALYVCNAETCEFIEKVELLWLQHGIVGSRFDLAFSDDGSRLYLTEESGGFDFNILELDCHNHFKPAFIRCYHIPAKTSFTTRTHFNHRLQTQFLATRNPAYPSVSEWRPEMLRFAPLDEVMHGVPRDMWNALWKSKVPYGDQKWNWMGPDHTISQQILDGVLNEQLLYFVGGNPANLTTVASALSLPGVAQLPLQGLSSMQLYAGNTFWEGPTKRGMIFLETPRRDYVMVSKAPVTLPPLSKVQPNAIQDPGDDMGLSAEFRSDGYFYTGPALPKEKGKGKRQSKWDQYNIHERRPWWIGGRMSLNKVMNGERFVMFDLDEVVYCCDFGPLGW